MEFKCIICNKNYKSYQSLWNHNHIYHNNNKQNIKIDENNGKTLKYKCVNCPKSFETINELDIHIKTVCKPAIKHNNIYKFTTNTFGKNKYPPVNLY
jgi:DNA-directed RNA polymerase subunit RPC12/RpoP